ncbi:MAG: transglycosylase SLT domain-containing protein, partial [Calditrichia bacterium]
KLLDMLIEGLNEYDDIIKAFADSLDWDWRLLASQIYQESRFDPAVRSWAGAVGLMQLMPRTARKYGAVNILEPYDNILAGTNYLHWLENYWAKIRDEQERIKFVLASYNTGFGHVEDARSLAKKYGKNPDKWEGNVREYVLKLSAKEFYNDEVVKHGYCRGEEPVRYVDEIFKRYKDYKRLIEG